MLWDSPWSGSTLRVTIYIKIGIFVILCSIKVLGKTRGTQIYIPQWDVLVFWLLSQFKGFAIGFTIP